MNKNIVLGTSRPGEFIMSLVRVAAIKGKEWASQDEINNLSEEHGIELNKDIQTFIQTVQRNLSAEHEMILAKYFTEAPFAIGLALIEGCETVESLIKKIKSLTHAELAYYLLATWAEVKFKKEEIENIKRKTDIVNWIEHNFSVSERGKWQIMKILFSPDEVKKELIDLFNHYYEEFYKVIEEKIMVELENHIQSYQEELEKAFLNDYTNMISIDINDHFKDQEVEVLVSYFIEIGCAYSSGGEGFVIGYRFYELADRLLNKEKAFIKYTSLFKVLSDQTRLNVLLLINEGPKYLAELAEILDSSTPAIKYHLNKLLLVNLIEVEHTDNRIYYQVNKETFDQFIKDIQKVFLL